MASDRPPPLFKPPAPRAPGHSLHKQALLANSHGAMDAVREDAVLSSLQECSRLSLDSSSSPPCPSGRAPIELHHWQEYWDSKQHVELPGRGRFCVYAAGSSGAVVFCLHGGGYTGLTWSLVARQLKHRYRVVAMDLRAHGETTTCDDSDFAAQTMTDDVVGVWGSLFGGAAERTPTLLVGHSMGGALAVRAAATKHVSGLEGVVVIDVVEGTALAALPHMMGVLHSRPAAFPSLQAALDWAVRTGTCKNREMAGVSLPSQLVRPPQGPDGSGGGGGGGGGGGPPAGAHEADGPWVWRTPLAASRPFWEGWYLGLSEKFISLPVPKMLLLAGTDRLDKCLTIGQMQGKFQLVLMPTAGHAIQEDEPLKTSEHLQQFLHRFRIGEPPLAIPRAAPGVRPVLPVVAGPLFSPGQQQQGPA